MEVAGMQEQVHGEYVPLQFFQLKMKVELETPLADVEEKQT